MKILLSVLYIGLLLLIFFGLPDKVLYSQDSIGWAPFILIFIVQPFILYHLLKFITMPYIYRLGICALSILLIGPSFGYFLGYREKQEYKLNGQTVNGIVYRKWYSTGKNKEWLFRCHYIVDGVRYSTFSETDENNKYKVGDTVRIVYSVNFPQKSTVQDFE